MPPTEIHTESYEGQCLCGAVRLKTQLKSNHVDACHCSMCRKWGGGPFLAVQCEGELQFEGGEHIATYQSSQWAERGFCNSCGTHLYYRLREGNTYALPVGLLQEQQAWAFTEEIFIDEKPDFYSFAQETKKLTGAEVFAQYSNE
ncbi:MULTISPECIES: GFA family protein [Pseudomonadota]|uniref:GFA family protein n=1 Tax=Pseudomonadota TaxID=1224 RepID=UPI0025BEDBF6|nr:MULTISPECIES: GFA family protein [Pseudomonadota]MBY8965201.1 GFA family protein [Algiphilus acroporae]MCI5070505.1 GFA family protein [Acidovorax sp.]MCI5103634.1 GFA family protein [Algiphilus sp.]